MAFSSGSRGVASEIALWVCLACSPVAGWLLYQQVRPVLGLDAADSVFTDGAPRAASARSETMDTKPSGVVELRADGRGHFNADVHVNGRRIPVMVDTGATIVALSYEDAESVGIYVKDSDFTGRVSTANGTGRVAYVMLDTVAIDDITVRGVRAAVLERGRMQGTLLGMSFLSRLGKFEIRGKTLIMQE